MDVLIGLGAYVIIGLILAKVFVFYRKTSYKNMNEDNQCVVICLVLIYPLVILLASAIFISVQIDKVFKKIF